jgi:hypothetical protein
VISIQIYISDSEIRRKTIPLLKTEKLYRRKTNWDDKSGKKNQFVCGTTPEHYLIMHPGITCSDLDEAIFQTKDEATMNFFATALETLLSRKMAKNIKP